jgi:UDP-3-O-[3-hydroxymyristoyl] glucosamine N-acyltransferase
LQAGWAAPIHYQYTPLKVTKGVKTPNATLTGNPAGDHNTSLRAQVYMKNLPNLEKRVKELEILVSQLSQKG